MSNRSPNLLKQIIFCALVILVIPLRGLAWGDIGHRVVARIASQRLSPPVKASVVELLKADIKLNQGYYSGNCPNVLSLGTKPVLTQAETATFVELGLACIASWADPPLKDARLYTSNWHFVDIPVNLNGPNGPVLATFMVARECPMSDERGDCAFLALKRLGPVLGNQTELVSSRAEALKFIVHIIGDLHQPLHCITDKKNFENANDLGDIGGNRKSVQFNVPGWDGNAHKDINPRWTKHWNLHSVWDEGLIDAYMKIQNLNEDSYVVQVTKPLATMTPNELAQIQGADSLMWMNESYKLAVDRAYNLPALDSSYGGYILQPAYYESNHGVVEQQLLKAGLRLAAFLNKTFA